MNLHSTVLFVKDIQNSKKFYTQILAFKIQHDFGKNIILDNGLAIWEIQPEHIIARNLSTTPESNRFELYFETENLENIFEKLQSAGIRFFHKIKEESWGQRTIRFFDPDHHLLEIGETLEVFVNNMHKRGLTPVQISEKSGIQLENVIGLIWK
jgi:catechol 2,3-dioxygenase-like lactoylglutathione lyase family enzyme